MKKVVFCIISIVLLAACCLIWVGLLSSAPKQTTLVGSVVIYAAMCMCAIFATAGVFTLWYVAYLYFIKGISIKNLSLTKKRIYLASPFFNSEEIEDLSYAEKVLKGRGFDVFSPREHEIRDSVEFGTPEWAKKTYKLDRDAIIRSDVVVMLYHGNVSDSGTAWEAGYACANNIPVVVVQLGDISNIMVHESCIANIKKEELETYDFERLPIIKYNGKMT